MKKILFGFVGLVALSSAAPVVAADLAPNYKAAPMVAPVAFYNWTGFYIGGHVGGGWADLGATELAPGSASFPVGTAFAKNNLSGFLGGVQGGYNWQTGSLVLGLEGDYSWADVSGTASTTSIPVPRVSSTVTAKISDIEMATARIGYAANNWLFFLKGGGAWGHGSSNGTVFVGGSPFSTTSSSTDRDGWVVGVGVEWGFARNWTAKLEYNHVDFGSKNVTINNTVSATSFVSATETVDIVKAGVNYRFNWGGY